MAAESWIAREARDHLFYRQFRQDLPFMVRDEVGRNGFQKVGTDMAVPDEQGQEMLESYLNELPRSGVQYLIFGHLGDNHLHANLLAKSADEFHRAKDIYLRP